MTGSRRRGTALYVVLALSLGLNLIGVGYFGYTNLSGAKQRPPKTVESTIDFVSRRYPEKTGEAIRAKLEERRAALQSALDDLKDARRATRRAMREKPFDRARVESAYEVARAKGQAFQEVLQGAIVDAVASVSQADRDGVDGDDPD